MNVKVYVFVKQIIHGRCQPKVHQAVKIHGNEKSGGLTDRGAKDRGVENPYAE